LQNSRFWKTEEKPSIFCKYNSYHQQGFSKEIKALKNPTYSLSSETSSIAVHLNSQSYSFLLLLYYVRQMVFSFYFVRFSY
jgi:hypothetical protein